MKGLQRELSRDRADAIGAVEAGAGGLSAAFTPAVAARVSGGRAHPASSGSSDTVIAAMKPAQLERTYADFHATRQTSASGP